MRIGVLGCYAGRPARDRGPVLARLRIDRYGSRMTPPPEPLPRLLAVPPVLYLAAFALGWLLHRLAPFQAMPVFVARGVGGLFAVASLSLLAWSRLTLHRAGTTSLPGRPSVALTLAGPYRWTRNPMCLGMAGVYLGLGLLLNAVAPLVLFLPVFAFLAFLAGSN
jgi:protein-S-isoprenylcysteine O-methyltransferase Ste14